MFLSASPETTEKDLIARAMKGDRDAFDQLYARHQSKVYGFIRSRTKTDQDAEEIAQECWIKVWQKMETYDANRASFRTFLRFWAGIKMLQFYSTQNAQRKVLKLFSDLTARFPDLEEEKEIEEVLAQLGVHSEPARLADADRLEQFGKLLRIIFSGRNPPHQAIAFGFCKLLEWKPREFVAELAETHLNDLNVRLEENYRSFSSLPQERVRVHFQPHRENLAKTFGEVVRGARTLKTYPALLNRIVGQTRLSEYYTGKKQPADQVAEWCNSVNKRFLSELARSLSKEYVRTAG